MTRAPSRMPGPCRLEGPAEPRIAAASRFLLRDQPACGAEFDVTEDQFSRAEREDDRDGRSHDGARG